jgi:hypothetical protein
MKASTVIRAAIATATLAFASTQAIATDEIPDKYMVSKGGVLYPHTGDSSQALFQTPPDARTLFPPGTLVGVLPADCLSVSSGSVGDFYRCDHDFAMKEEVLQDGRTVYRVIDPN